MSNIEMVSVSREQLKSIESWIDGAVHGVLQPIARDFQGVVGHNAEGLSASSVTRLDELRALLAAPVPVWNPHPAEANLAALLILLAQSGVKVSGGIGDEPWSVEPAAQPVPPAGGEPEVLATVDAHGAMLRGSKPLRSVELVDRAHVTRLLAENKRLDLMVAQGDYNRDATVIALRAELSELKAAQPQGEPVAEIVSKFGDPEAFGEREMIALKDISKLPYGTKLYASPPAAVADALRKDAERYKWLRERDLETLHCGGVFAGQTPDNIVLNGETLDEAIDAAMSKRVEQPKGCNCGACPAGCIAQAPKELMP